MQTRAESPPDTLTDLLPPLAGGEPDPSELPPRPNPGTTAARARATMRDLSALRVVVLAGQALQDLDLSGVIESSIRTLRSLPPDDPEREVLKEEFELLWAARNFEIAYRGQLRAQQARHDAAEDALRGVTRVP